MRVNMVLVGITTEIGANGIHKLLLILLTYKKWYHLAESDVNQLWKLSECAVVHCTRAPQTRDSLNCVECALSLTQAVILQN